MIWNQQSLSQWLVLACQSHMYITRVIPLMIRHNNTCSRPQVWVKSFWHIEGLYSLERCSLSGIGIPIVNLRRSNNCLRFILGSMVSHQCVIVGLSQSAPGVGWGSPLHAWLASVNRPVSQMRAPSGGLSRTSRKLWQDYSSCYMFLT